MLKKFPKRIWRENGKAAAFPELPFSVEEGPSLSQEVTFGAHIYRQKDEVAQVIFTHRARHIQRIIVDNNGQICGFPGFFDPKEIIMHLENGLLPKPVIRFRTEFWKEPDGRFLMVWEVQPDGHYWEDENDFGGTSDPEVQLYSHIDRSGSFTYPQHFYNYVI